MKPFRLGVFIGLALGGNISLAVSAEDPKPEPLPFAQSQFVPKGWILAEIPRAIEQFRIAYARDYPGSGGSKFQRWDYASFLQRLLRGTNARFGNGEILAAEHFTALDGFAEVQAIRKGYPVPTWRGSSGFDVTLADATIRVYVNELRQFGRLAGRSLSYYDESEKDWNDAADKDWCAEFDRATSCDADLRQANETLFDAKEIRLTLLKWSCQRNGLSDRITLELSYSLPAGIAWDLWADSHSPSSPKDSLGAAVIEGARDKHIKFSFEMEGDTVEDCFGVNLRRRDRSDEWPFSVIMTLPPGSRRPLTARITRMAAPVSRTPRKTEPVVPGPR